MIFVRYVAGGESSDPIQSQTQVSVVLNVQLECNAKEPGSLVWQSECILNRSDGTPAMFTLTTHVVLPFSQVFEEKPTVERGQP